MSTATKLITVEEFARMPQPDNPCELVRGEIIEMNPPKPRHGQICAGIVYVGRRFNEDHDCMHVLCNDAGVITERDPDT
ncbi:MAG: Uma2 family endonuclease, partial [Planctomycetaceae bacterium]